MRTTVDLADDVAAEVERLRREEGKGLSEAVNDLARAGMIRPKERKPYVHKSFRMGPAKIDVTSTGEVLSLLDVWDRAEPS